MMTTCAVQVITQLENLEKAERDSLGSYTYRSEYELGTPSVEIRWTYLEATEELDIGNFNSSRWHAIHWVADVFTI